MQRTTQKKQPLDLDAMMRRFIQGVLGTGVLTQEELAKFSGVSRSSIAHWLAEGRSMTLKNASKLVGLFGFDRFVQFMIMETASTHTETTVPDLVQLLEQVNAFLRSQLAEATAEQCSECEEGDEGDETCEQDACREGEQ